jgi:hypothetical protein
MTVSPEMIEIPVRQRRRKVVNMGKNDMQRIAITITLCVCCANTGCASRILRPAALGRAVPGGSDSQSSSSLAQADRPVPDHLSTQGNGVVWAADEPGSDQALASDEAPRLNPAEPEGSATRSDDPVDIRPGPSEDRPLLNRAKEDIPAPKSDRPADAMLEASQDRPMPAEAREEILPPQADSAAEVVPGAADDDQDRFAREVTDVRLDIRPPQGPLPPDLSPDETVQDQAEASDSEGICNWEMHTPIICSFNPWTICYRPLYFEDIQLERYGRTFGIVQPGVSAARFFCSVPLLPYKMVVRPPRSCECSNGFSRRGDQPLPGYGARTLRLDAAAVEAAVMAGIFLALP